MVGWQHQLNGHEFEQVLGGGEGQRSLVCCSPWGCKDLDMTERLNKNPRPPGIGCRGRQRAEQVPLDVTVAEAPSNHAFS